MQGEDFTVELRVYKSAGWTREQVLRTLEAIFESDEDNGNVYLYPRESKIMMQTILEITGIKRDTTPRPVISQDLLLKLEYYLARNAALAEKSVDDE